MDKKKAFQIVVLIALLTVGVVGNFQAVNAGKDTAKKKVVKMEYGQDYDVSIGKAGVYFADSIMQGTMVLIREEHPENFAGECNLLNTYPDPCPGGRSLEFYQRMLNIRIYDGEEGQHPFDYVKGLAYVYFNLDIIERRAWDRDEDQLMSIWYFHDYLAKWIKCPTFLRRDASAPFGRLVCYLEEFGTYGLAVKQQPLVVKLVKLGLITATPTNTPVP